MELYRKNKEGQLQETNLRFVLKKQFANAGYEVELGRNNDESARWLEIKKEDNKTQVTISILFEEDYNAIDEINIFSAEIKRVVDEENSIRII